MTTRPAAVQDAGLRPVALLVHAASVTYAGSVVAFIRDQIAAHAGRAPHYAECEDVAAAGVAPGSVVFVVGDGFPRYARMPGCRYVFVNFSLLHRMRWWRPASPAARRWMRAKRDALHARRDQYDMVLDFHPDQALLLERDLARAGVPVRWFMTGVTDDALRASPPAQAQRRWDVCFVATDSPRRARLRASLEQRGLSLSPQTAAGLHTVIRDCRVVANVHFAACDTLEAPRIVHALAAGVCLVTEPCLRLADVAPPACYVTTSYRRMPGVIEDLVRDRARADAIGKSAAEHMRGRYAVSARARWQTLVAEAMAL